MEKFGNAIAVTLCSGIAKKIIRNETVRDVETLTGIDEISDGLVD